MTTDSQQATLERYERQLRLFERLISSTPDFVYAFDREGRFIYANRRLLEVWGMKLTDVLGKTCLELGYQQWHHDMHMREIAQVISTRQPIKGEVPFKAPVTGIFGIYEYIFNPVLAPDGEVEMIAGTTRDVTDRKRAEEALREREERYRELFSSMTEGFCLVERVSGGRGDPLDFVHIEENPAFRAQSGLAGVLGKSVRQLIPSEADEWIEIYDRTLRTGEAARFERSVAATGRILEVYVYRAGGAESGRVGVVFRDISKRRSAEEQLKRNHDIFFQVIQNNPFGIYVIDADFRLRQISRGAEKVFSQVSGAVGRDFAEVLRCIWNEPFATEAINLFRHTLETGEAYESVRTVEQRHDIGEVEAYDWRIERITLPDGRYGVVCYFYDLSERQSWEAALRVSDERFHMVARATNDAIWDWDFSTNGLWWNEGVQTLFGYEREKVDGRIDWWVERVHPDDRVRVTADVHRIIDGPATSWRGEYRFRRADGNYADVYDRGYVMRDEKGKATRMLGAMQDLTEWKKAQGALARAQEDLKKHAENLEILVEERTAKLRDTITELEALSYSISHDMRAPLRAMQGFAEALLDDYKNRLDAEGVAYLERISAASRRLDSLIQDILLYTSVGRERLVLTPVDVQAVIREVIQTYHPNEASHVTVCGTFAPAMGHEAFLSQVFSNLITNALKFVAKGKTPEVRIRAEDAGDAMKIWVEDNGIGIAPQHLKSIFQVFGRVYGVNEYPGTGIGLAIVKRAIQRLGGEVGVESTIGQGSRFWITLKKAEGVSGGA